MTRFLAAVRTRLRLRAVAFSGLVVLDLLLLLVLLGLPAGTVGPGLGRTLYLAFSGLVLAVASVALWRRATLAPSDVDVARHIARHGIAAGVGAQRFGDGLTSAVELAREPVDVADVSPTLVRMHIARVADELAGVTPAAQVSLAPLRLPGALATGLAATLALITLLVPGAVGRFLSSLRSTPFAAIGGLATTDANVVLGQIRLTYRHPAYTAIPDRIVEGATGDLRAIRGTEVLLEAMTDAAVDEAWLTLAAGEPVRLAVTDRRRAAGSLILMEPGTWHAEFRVDGAVTVDPLAHTIAVDDDLYPEVALLEPTADLEVDELSGLAITWQARDDFAVGEARLVIVRGGVEDRRPLAVDPARVEQGGPVDWPSLGLDPSPGDELSFYVEVLDNDTVSGPKRSVSETRRVRVRSARDLHAELIASVERLLNEMLGTLAETLTAPTPTSANVREVADIETTLDERLGQHVASLDGILEGLWMDPLGNEATYETLSLMRVSLEALAAEKTSFLSREAAVLRRPFGDPQLVAEMQRLRGKLTTEVETDVLALDDLIYRERSEEIRRLAKSLIRDQEKLTALLQEYARTSNPETLAEINQLIPKMERDLAELDRRMQEMGSAAAAEEFLNLDALRQKMGGADAASSLDKLKEDIEAGDVAAATEKAEALLASLQETLAALESDSRAGLSVAGQRMFQQANEVAQRLQALTQAEAKLVNSTDGVKREIENRRFGDDPSEFFKMQKERAQQVTGMVDEALKELAKDRALAEQQAAEAQVAELEAALREQLQRGASIDEFERKQRQIFALRRMASGPQLDAQRSLEAALRAAERGTGALSGPWLRDALRDTRELSRHLRDASDELPRSSPGEGGASPMGASGGQPGMTREGHPAQGAIQEALGQVAELLRDLGALDAILNRPSDEDANALDVRRMEEFGRKQGSLRTEADEVRDLVDELAAEMPEIPPELGEQIEEASDFMELASRSLDAHDVGSGLRNEQQALDRLQQALEAAQKAAQQCESGGAGGKKGGAGASGSRPGGFAFIPPGASGEPRFRQEGQGDGAGALGGLRGQANAKVKIPGADDALAPAEFRRDVLEGMKEPRPEGYQELIDRYYRRLVQ